MKDEQVVAMGLAEKIEKITTDFVSYQERWKIWDKLEKSPEGARDELLCMMHKMYKQNELSYCKLFRATDKLGLEMRDVERLVKEAEADVGA